jgi:hypothetical protein
VVAAFNRASCGADPVPHSLPERLQRLDRADHHLEFDRFAGRIELDELDAPSCHLPIWAENSSAAVSTSEVAIRPGIGDCTNGGRNTICSDSSEASRLLAATVPARGFRPPVYPRGHSSRFTMKDEKDKNEPQTGKPAKNPSKDAKQDRLKLALRENLKRRKSQARGRSDMTAAPTDDAGVALHDNCGKKPGE